MFSRRSSAEWSPERGVVLRIALGIALRAAHVWAKSCGPMVALSAGFDGTRTRHGRSPPAAEVAAHLECSAAEVVAVRLGQPQPACCSSTTLPSVKKASPAALLPRVGPTNG